MKCAHCDADARVAETRGNNRRRACPNGHTFWTTESLAPEIPTRRDSPRKQKADALREAIAAMEGEKGVVIAHVLGVSENYVGVVRHRMRKAMNAASTKETA